MNAPRRQSLDPAAMRRVVLRAGFAGSLGAALLTGCASPGPPRSPSLQLPAPAKDLTALRRANLVELSFTLPHTTSDGGPLRSTSVTATICRALDAGACRSLATLPPRAFPVSATPAELTDTLPPALATGAPHLLTYRVQLANERGRTAEYSAAAYAASGAAPATVAALQADGSRQGIVLRWNQPAGDTDKVVLQREDLNPSTAPPQPAAHESAAARPVKASPHAHSGSGPKAAQMQPGDGAGVVLLSSGDDSGKPVAGMTLDTSALTDEPYRYTAERRRTVQLSGHELELRSGISAPVLFTLHDVFPPPAPTDLIAAGYASSDAATYAVDLIWQPVEDASLAGYNVYRQPLDADNAPIGQATRLNAEPVRMPAFHDATAVRSQRYRYRVTALDAKGNESTAVIKDVEPLAP